jgi:adenosylhomocysteinase
MSQVPHDVADLGLAPAGKARIEWADRHMPVLAAIRERFAAERPLEGHVIAACLHVTTETANLMRTLEAGGAEVILVASNPLSTQDETAAGLVGEYGIPVYAIRGEDNDTYYKHIDASLDAQPTITMDDGCDLVNRCSTASGRSRPSRSSAAPRRRRPGSSGYARWRRPTRSRYPIIAVNDTPTKHLFDNRFGTGQSTLDGIMRATNVLIAGKTVVVAGYGYWAAASPAARWRAWAPTSSSSRSTPFARSRPLMEGYRVMPMAEAAGIGDVFVTVTGNTSVLRREHFEQMRDGAIVANSGHFDVEIDIPALEKLATDRRVVRPNAEEFELPTAGGSSCWPKAASSTSAPPRGTRPRSWT